MRRYHGFLLVLGILALSGCINAPDDSGSGKGSHPGSTGSFFGDGDVTANGQGGRTINGSVRVPDGQKTGNLQTVNGAIRVGNQATFDAAQTVNGSIDMGNHASAGSLKTVNGSITLDDDARVSQSVTTVNGSMTLHHGADVDGALTNVNGTIRLNGAHVAGGIKTVEGDIYIEGASHVEGGILVERPKSASWFRPTRDPRVVIGPGSVVQGELRFERKVELYVSDKATIGPVVGATPVRYAGEGPAG
jgi:hypothetical protein